MTKCLLDECWENEVEFAFRLTERVGGELDRGIEFLIKFFAFFRHPTKPPFNGIFSHFFIIKNEMAELLYYHFYEVMYNIKGI